MKSWKIVGLGMVGAFLGMMVFTGVSWFYQDVFTVDRSGTIDFRVSNTGNIGIGMQGALDSPGSRLVVKASGTGTTSSALDVQASNGASRLFVRDDGNIGIGTTSPGARMDVQGGEFYLSHVTGKPFARLTSNNNNAILVGNAYYDGSVRYSANGGSSEIRFGIGLYPGDIMFRTAPTGAANAVFASTEIVRFTQGGNVGIGTTVPTSKLHVVGLPLYANNAAAIAGGLTAGAFYRTGGDPDLVCVVH